MKGVKDKLVTIVIGALFIAALLLAVLAWAWAIIMMLVWSIQFWGLV